MKVECEVCGDIHECTQPRVSPAVILRPYIHQLLRSFAKTEDRAEGIAVWEDYDYDGGAVKIAYTRKKDNSIVHITIPLELFRTEQYQRMRALILSKEV